MLTYLSDSKLQTPNLKNLEPSVILLRKLRFKLESVILAFFNKLNLFFKYLILIIKFKKNNLLKRFYKKIYFEILK